MIVLRTALLVLGCCLLASAQIPGLGWCPDYAPMADFDLSRYLGVWYEAERYFTLLEAGTRCVKSNYTQTADGKIHVDNEVTNRITGIKRVLEGEMRKIGKAGEGKLSIKYSLPLSVDSTYLVLRTDYDTYSVVWSCSSLGPLHTQSAWVMTRERQAPGTIMQKAYGVLDEYNIPRTYFVTTDQKDCDVAAAVPDVVPVDPAATTTRSLVKTPSKEMMPPEPVESIPTEDKKEIVPEVMMPAEEPEKDKIPEEDQKMEDKPAMVAAPEVLSEEMKAPEAISAAVSADEEKVPVQEVEPVKKPQV